MFLFWNIRCESFQYPVFRLAKWQRQLFIIHVCQKMSTYFSNFFNYFFLPYYITKKRPFLFGKGRSASVSYICLFYYCFYLFCLFFPYPDCIPAQTPFCSCFSVCFCPHSYLCFCLCSCPCLWPPKFTSFSASTSRSHSMALLFSFMRAVSLLPDTFFCIL